MGPRVGDVTFFAPKEVSWIPRQIIINQGKKGKYKHVKGQLGPLLDRWNLEISKNPKTNGSFLFRAATKDPCDIKSIDLISVEIIIEYVE